MLNFGKYTAVALVVAGSLAACDSGPKVVDTKPAVGAQEGTQTIEGAIKGTPVGDIIDISGKKIKLDPNVTIRSGTMPVSLADLRDGMKVKVVAKSSSGGALEGSLVDVVDSVGLPNVERGDIAGYADKGTFYEFHLKDKLIRGDASTQILDAAGPAKAAALADAIAIEVTGLQRAEYVYATKIEMKPKGTGTK